MIVCVLCVRLVITVEPNDRAWTVNLQKRVGVYVVREIREMDLERSLGLK